MRLDGVLERASASLAEVSESPRLDAELLLARALDLPRSYLFAHPEEQLDEASMRRFFEAVEQRRQGQPLAYITGEKEFWSLPLSVGPGVLVPRPDTELLVELALREIPRRAEWTILDLGTGSGAIAIALARERPACRVVATDVSDIALATAGHNAARHAPGNVELVQSDWTAALGDRCFDLVVSNPPYVRAGDPLLPALRHEPREALVSGADGLDAIRVLARDCARLIAPGGSFLFEHGADQEHAVAAILEGENWAAIECFTDLGGHPRVTRGSIRG